MQDKFSNSRFASLYLWSTKAKYTMGIFFCFFVLIYLLLGMTAVEETVKLDFWTSVEMMFACFFIGVAQQLILPTGKFTKARCLLWMLTSSAILLLFTLFFQWFRGFPFWCLVLFVACFIIAMGAMLISYYLELYHETRNLNRQLEQFQKGRK